MAMSSHELNVFLKSILELLKSGNTDEVIEIIEDHINRIDKNYSTKQ